MWWTPVSRNEMVNYEEKLPALKQEVAALNEDNEQYIAESLHWHDHDYGKERFVFVKQITQLEDDTNKARNKIGEYKQFAEGMDAHAAGLMKNLQNIQANVVAVMNQRAVTFTMPVSITITITIPTPVAIIANVVPISAPNTVTGAIRLSIDIH